MTIPVDHVLYSINVEDVLNVVEQESLPPLTKAQIAKIGDKIGDYIDWYEAIRLAIEEIVPASDN
jgi:hypothetical protein